MKGKDGSPVTSGSPRVKGTVWRGYVAADLLEEVQLTAIIGFTQGKDLVIIE